MEGVDQKQLITDDYLSTILSNILDEFAPEKAHADEWKTPELFNAVFDIFGAHLENEVDPTSLSRHDLGETLFEKLQARYTMKEAILGAPTMRYHERIVMLSVLDGLWKDHLLSMDHLKEGIGLRGYAQQDPLVAYKKESFEMFEAMMMRFQEDTTRHLFRMQIIGPDGTPIETPEQFQQIQAQQAQLQAQQQALLQAQQQFQHPPVIDPGTQPETRPGNQPSLPVTPPNAPGKPEQLPPLQQKPKPTRSTAPSTTIDALEREFERKKQRELDQARAAGSSNGSSNGHGPQGPQAKRSAATIRVHAAPARSSKKCHGVEA